MGVEVCVGSSRLPRLRIPSSDLWANNAGRPAGERGEGDLRSKSLRRGSALDRRGGDRSRANRKGLVLGFENDDRSKRESFADRLNARSANLGDLPFLSSKLDSLNDRAGTRSDRRNVLRSSDRARCNAGRNDSDPRPSDRRPATPTEEERVSIGDRGEARCTKMLSKKYHPTKFD